MSPASNKEANKQLRFMLELVLDPGNVLFSAYLLDHG